MSVGYMKTLCNWDGKMMTPEDSPHFNERNKAWTSKIGFYCKLCSAITCKKDDFVDFEKWKKSEDA